jgi:hypothetical protein
VDEREQKVIQNVNPGLTLEHQKDLARHHVNWFNERFPPGTTVWWWSTATLGPIYETRVSKPAFVNIIDGKADAEVFLVDVPGSVPVVRCQAPNEYQRDQLKVCPLDTPVVPLVIQGRRLMGHADKELFQWKDPLIKGFGSREHLKSAAVLLRQAADCLEAAYAELGEE